MIRPLVVFKNSRSLNALLCGYQDTILLTAAGNAGARVEAVAIRIVAFEYQHEWSQLNSRDLSAWTEPNDLCSLIVKTIEVDLTDNPFIIAHGISDNRFKRLDLSDTKRIFEYDPKS